MRSIFEVVAVHKDILTSGMSMQITAHYDLALPVKLSNHTFDVPVDGMKVLGGDTPAAVQVLTGQRTPIVAVDHTIWIQHRYDLENEVFAKSLRLWRIADEKVDNALHHPAGI